MKPAIVYADTAPSSHAGDPECGLSCRGVWRETSDQGRKAWLWQCDKRGCPHGIADRPVRRAER